MEGKASQFNVLSAETGESRCYAIQRSNRQPSLGKLGHASARDEKCKQRSEGVEESARVKMRSVASWEQDREYTWPSGERVNHIWETATSFQGPVHRISEFGER